MGRDHVATLDALSRLSNALEVEKSAVAPRFDRGEIADYQAALGKACAAVRASSQALQPRMTRPIAGGDQAGLAPPTLR